MMVVVCTVQKSSMCYGTASEIRGQLCKVSSLLAPLCGFGRTHTRCQACLASALPYHIILSGAHFIVSTYTQTLSAWG